MILKDLILIVIYIYIYIIIGLEADLLLVHQPSRGAYKKHGKKVSLLGTLEFRGFQE